MNAHRARIGIRTDVAQSRSIIVGRAAGGLAFSAEKKTPIADIPACMRCNSLGNKRVIDTPHAGLSSVNILSLAQNS